MDKTTDDKADTVTVSHTSKEVLIVTTSIGKGIREQQLLRDYNINKVMKYYTHDAADHIAKRQGTLPAAIVFQQMSNDIKIDLNEAGQCAEKLVQLTQQTKEKFPNSKVIISLPPGRGDTHDRNFKTAKANLQVKEQLMKTDVYIVDTAT